MRIELTKPEWSNINESELSCIFAESGADRELDFDRESDEELFFESHYFPGKLQYSKEFANPFEFILFVIENNTSDEPLESLYEQIITRCPILDGEITTNYISSARDLVQDSYRMYMNTDWNM